MEEPDEDLDVLTDDELDMIGDFMVKESLDTATNNLDNLKVRKRIKVNFGSKFFLKDFTDLDGELSASDLREDQFTVMDYYRAGLSPPPYLKDDPSMGKSNR